MTRVRMFLKRHKKAPVILIVIAALIISYPVWPGFVRCQVVRLKLAAYLQFQEMIHSDDDKDCIKKNEYGADTCFFENKNTLRALKKIALSSQIDDATGHQMQPWPTPFYYVGKTEIGGNGYLVYHELFHFYVLYPSSNETNELRNYVDQIKQNGEMDGLG